MSGRPRVRKFDQGGLKQLNRNQTDRGSGLHGTSLSKVAKVGIDQLDIYTIGRVEIGNVNTPIRHTLGKNPLVIAIPMGVATLYMPQEPTASEIYLQASATIDVFVWLLA